MIAVLLVVTLAGLQVATTVVTRHRAQAAADLGALAGATYLPAGQQAACARATAVTRAMHADDLNCAVEGIDVVLTVEVAVRFGRWTLGPARAAARAGPDDG